MRRIKSTHSSTNNSRNKSKTPNAAGSTPTSKRKVAGRFIREDISADIFSNGPIHVTKSAISYGLCGFDVAHSQKREKLGHSRRPPHTLPGEQQGTNTKPEKK